MKAKSDKKKLRDKIGHTHLQVLKLERRNNNTCEICGRRSNNIGRFHIIRVARAPRLEFVDENVLLACWGNCHFPWHHYGPNDPRTEAIEARIKELLGVNYIEKLRKIEQLQDKHSMFYLECLHEYMKERLAEEKRKPCYSGHHAIADSAHDGNLS